MPEIIARDYVADSLSKILPRRFVVEKFQRIPDVITKSTAILKQQRIGRSIVAGRVIPGGRVAEFTLTLAIPNRDIARAETRLDDDVVTLLNAIDEIPNLRWTTAEKRILSETVPAPCYDITLELVYHHSRQE